MDLNPDKKPKSSQVCSDPHHTSRLVQSQLDVEEMAGELTWTLALVHNGQLRELPDYRLLPDQLLELRHVAFEWRKRAC